MIRLDRVSKTYTRAGGGEPVRALSEISADIADGAFVTIVGPSGCGKSTLLYIVGGFVPASGGAVLVEGKPIAGPGPDRGPVFQEFALFPWKTVRQNIRFGLAEQNVPRAEADRRVDELLDLVHLRQYAALYPKELSGGMKQRVAIARTLAYRPRTLLMDEPFGALDAHTRAKLQDELLQIWERERKTVLFITHGVDEAVYLSDRILVMSAAPGAIKADIAVDLPRPRRREELLRHPRYQELVIEIGRMMDTTA
ncbi:ABC transporter ATP-binding protein [Limobrevibacterium gyesilva]|uniref:ABC transporter ATP-binding protein n=1 Tax=Limobrevibacterium gyesilva TaxID=2991712 RepID=A0AA41YKI0_9PROT|nr:ABC transporter ATP-binding protein [Limobrevibacterium gyesilva]MCW3475484.1 ABC transporter ATP-binding protein [Limobrevibacterium gyesilva]